MNVLILKSSAAAGLLFAGFLQAPSTPPMKLGLWETTGTTTMQMPGMTMPPPRPVKTRVCVTAETWAKSFGSTGDRMAGCTRSNESYGVKHYSFDLSCPATNGTAHFEIDFSSEESGHGKLHLEMNPNGRHAVVDTVLDTHFVSADCGPLAPGKAQIVQ